MAPHGIVPPVRTLAKTRAVPLLLLVGIALGPACANMPTKPRPTVVVTGKVSDRLGRPIVGATVDFYPAQNSLSAFYKPQRAATDSAGSYSFELVGGYWNLVIQPPSNVGYGGYYYEARVAVSPTRSRFDLVIDGFRVSGRVIAPTGAILTDASVSATGSHVFAESSTQPGVFFLLLPAGSYYVSASPSYFSGFPPQHMAIPVQSDTTLDILLGGDLVTGTVSGPGGTPLAGLLVTASGTSEAVRARTALDGTYSLYAHAGNYRFICEPRGSDSYILPRISSLRTITGPGTFNFDLAGVEWTGTVRSSATLSPIEGVRMTAALFGDSFNRSAFSLTDPSGQFRLVLEPNREYSLSFHSTATADSSLPSIFATSDTTFDIVLDPRPAP